MFPFRRITPHEYVPQEKGLVDLNKSEFYSPSEIDPFLIEQDQPAHSSDQSCTLTTDITMLFNQKRLDKLSKDQVIRYFEKIAIRDPQVNELRKKLTDDQLCMLVKSRYIQTPSELLSYSQYLNTALDSELAAIVQQEQAQEQQAAPPVDSSETA